MGDFLRIILDSINYLFPLKIVRQYERACVYAWGRFWLQVGPGIYPIIPFFMAIHEVSVVPTLIATGRKDITLKDGRPLSFDAAATCRVVDVNLAVNTVDSYSETIQELVAAVLADKLADVDPSRLEPEGRRRLLSDLTKWCDGEAKVFGIEIARVRFTSFVLNTKTIRLLIDAGAPVPW